MNIALIYGGRSGEHEISLISASSIARGFSKEHKIILIGINKSGRWFLQPQSELERILNNKSETFKIIEDENSCINIVPGAKQNSFTVNGKSLNVDLVFPALHGTYGEDGTIQGLLDKIGRAHV